MSNVTELISELCEAGRHPQRSIAASVEETGKDAVGMFPLFLPEELVYAAGFLPVGLWGGITSFQLADQYLQSFCCNIIRANMELAMNGSYSFLKGILIPSQCDTLKCACENMKVAMPNTPIIGVTVPHNRSIPGARRQLLAEFDYLTEELIKLQPSPQPLRIEEAFQVYEAYRRVMMEFIALVPQHLNTISAKTRHYLIKAAYFMDKAAYTRKMRAIVEALKQAPRETFRGVRFVATGIMIDTDPVLDLLGELNIAITDDLLCHESLQFRTPTPAGGDARAKMAGRILDIKGASPLYDYGKPRGNLLADMAEATGADGVLFCLTKFCDPDAFDQPLVKKDLDRRGIRVLNIEMDQHVESVGQLRTRIQGFLEMQGL